MSTESTPGSEEPGFSADTDREQTDSRSGGTATAAGMTILAMLREVVIVVGAALAISLFLKSFLFQMFYIPSPSMEDTLTKGDRVVVSKLTPGLFDVQRGDVIVFKDPGNWLPAKVDTDKGPIQNAITSALTFVGILPHDAGEHLIKRTIGMPGDVVKCCDEQGRLLINDVPIDEVYLKPGSLPSEREFEVTVPEGRLWVMGDNRQQSKDSRSHRDQPGSGTVAMEDVVGRATMVAWPVFRWDWLSHYSQTFDQVGAARDTSGD